MMLKRWIIGSEQPDDKKLFFWNVIGSGIYAAASMILTYLTIHLIGAEEGGMFAIGLTIAQMFVYIAYYETRNYMVTDAENRFSFEDYHFIKLINCLVMLLVSVLYAWLKRYDPDKMIIVILVCVYRMLDGYADGFEGQFHKEGRLDLAGKSMAFRTLISVILYFFVLAVTRNLLYALLAAILSGIVGIYLFNIMIFDGFGTLTIRWDREKSIEIWKECFPLFVGMFLWTYLLSASRIAVDNVMDSADQAYYQVLFLPVSVINLFAGFLIRPSLIELTDLYVKRDMSGFWKIIRRIFFYLAVFTLVCMAGAYLVGIPVLELLAGCDLSRYRLLFVFLIFAGGFNAIGYLLYYVLTIFRNQTGILCGYGLASVCAFLISNGMTAKWGLWGAAGSYMITILVLLVVFRFFIKNSHFVDKK